MQNVSQLRSIIRKFEQINDQINSIGCNLGISIPQCHAIMEIGNASNINSKTLAAHLSLNKSTISRTIDGLVKIGLVSRDIPEKNRRMTELTLTTKGLEIYDEINSMNNDIYKHALDHIPIDEQTIFIHTFEKFVNNLKLK